MHEAGPRAALRRRRSAAAVHVPEHLARPRADRDLLVHLRGRHARAGLARAALRALGRAGARRTRRRRSSSRRCSTGATPRSCATSSASGRRSPRSAGSSERDYSTLLTEATGIRYDPRNYLADMDSGFYSADYLRAWIRAAQLRAFLLARGRRGLVAERGDGRHPARPLPRGNAADERRGGRPARLRPARHRAARRGSLRGVASALCCVSSAWISRVSFATCSVRSLSCCVSAVFDSSSWTSLSVCRFAASSSRVCFLSIISPCSLSRSACRVCASRISGAAYAACVEKARFSRMNGYGSQW